MCAFYLASSYPAKKESRQKKNKEKPQTQASQKGRSVIFLKNQLKIKKSERCRLLYLPIGLPNWVGRAQG